MGYYVCFHRPDGRLTYIAEDGSLSTDRAAARSFRAFEDALHAAQVTGRTGDVASIWSHADGFVVGTGAFSRREVARA